MEKLKFLGIGPKMVVITFPYLAIAIALSIVYFPLFRFAEDPGKIIRFFGILILLGGIVFYGFTANSLIRGLRKTQLLTSGTYSLCQNPLYAAFILMILPGLALILNSWLVLLTSLVMYVPFKIYIHQEYEEMERFFGDEYLEYRKNTPELIPFPLKKWFGS